MWPRRRRKSEGQYADSTCIREGEAKEALREADRTTRKVDHQVGIAESLRERWAEVHERNNLAELFREDMGRTH